MKQVILLFGEMGAGKSYHATRLASQHGLKFIEGDDFVPPEMAERFKRLQFPTEDMINHVVVCLARRVWNSANIDHPGYVIPQALYRNDDREFLIDYWEGLGYKVTTIWVRVPFWQNVKQLWSRPNGLKWVVYWLMNKPFFQKPTHPYEDLTNPA